MDSLTNTKINKTMGAIFKKYRLKKHLTQEQVAEKIDKSPKAISLMETGRIGTSKKTLISIINLLEIPPNELYGQFITYKTYN